MLRGNNEEMKRVNKASRAIVLSLMCLSLAAPLSGCGKRTPNVTGVTDGGGGGTGGPMDDGGGMPFDDDLGGAVPGDANGDDFGDLPQQPLDTPEPLPAPKKPVKRGKTPIFKAISNTIHFSLPPTKYFKASWDFVYMKLSWQPVEGAKEYWIFKGQMPHFEEARREFAYKVIPAGRSNEFNDGLEPPNLSGGGFWDKLKRVAKSLVNLPGIPYTYKVIAVDANGLPMNESKKVTTAALPPIQTPTLTAPVPNKGQNNGNVNNVPMVPTVTPQFKWKDDLSGGRKPDGYFVSVFPSVDFRSGALPPSSLAYWSTYRTYASGKNGEHTARYGNDKVNSSNYKGTLPFDITFNLRPGGYYSWTVISVKTDSGDMRTAKAISKSWSGFGHFRVDPKAKDGSGACVQASSIYNRATNYVSRQVSSFMNRRNPYARPQYNSYASSNNCGQASKSSVNAQRVRSQRSAYPQQTQNRYPQYPQQTQQRAPQPTVQTQRAPRRAPAPQQRRAPIPSRF